MTEISISSKNQLKTEGAQENLLSNVKIQLTHSYEQPGETQQHSLQLEEEAIRLAIISFVVNHVVPNVVMQLNESAELPDIKELETKSQINSKGNYLITHGDNGFEYQGTLDITANFTSDRAPEPGAALLNSKISFASHLANSVISDLRRAIFGFDSSEGKGHSVIKLDEKNGLVVLEHDDVFREKE